MLVNRRCLCVESNVSKHNVVLSSIHRMFFDDVQLLRDIVVFSNLLTIFDWVRFNRTKFVNSNSNKIYAILIHRSTVIVDDFENLKWSFATKHRQINNVVYTIIYFTSSRSSCITLLSSSNSSHVEISSFINENDTSSKRASVAKKKNYNNRECQLKHELVAYFTKTSSIVCLSSSNC